MSGLPIRILTGLVLLLLFLALVWMPALDIGLAAFVALIAATGLHEYYALARKKGLEPDSTRGVIVGAFLAISPLYDSYRATAAILFLALAILMVSHVVRGRGAITGMAASAFGLVYVTWTAAHVTLTHRLDGIGPGLLTLLLLAVAITDTGAYFVGKSIGRHKMAPIVSPNKTWEGAIGGFLCAVAAMFLVVTLRDRYEWSSLPDWTPARYLLTGAVLSVASQLGDLVESSLKRDAGVKDAGSIFPGHGGALDRCDGFLFAAPVLYYMSVL